MLHGLHPLVVARPPLQASFILPSGCAPIKWISSSYLLWLLVKGFGPLIIIFLLVVLRVVKKKWDALKSRSEQQRAVNPAPAPSPVHDLADASAPVHATTVASSSSDLVSTPASAPALVPAHADVADLACAPAFATVLDVSAASSPSLAPAPASTPLLNVAPAPASLLNIALASAAALASAPAFMLPFYGMLRAFSRLIALWERMKSFSLESLPVVLVISYLLVPSVSTTIFQSWSCIAYEFDRRDVNHILYFSYLRDDLYVQCSEYGFSNPEHNAIKAVAILLIFIWPVGMAVSYTHLTLPTIYSV